MLTLEMHDSMSTREIIPGSSHTDSGHWVARALSPTALTKDTRARFRLCIANTIQGIIVQQNFRRVVSVVLHRSTSQGLKLVLYARCQQTFGTWNDAQGNKSAPEDRNDHNRFLQCVTGSLTWRHRLNHTSNIAYQGDPVHVCAVPDNRAPSGRCLVGVAIRAHTAVPPQVQATCSPDILASFLDSNLQPPETHIHTWLEEVREKFAANTADNL